MARTLIEESKKYNYKVYIGDGLKIFESPDYHYIFNMETGQMASWGKQVKDDPVFAPAPNILDLEITTKCKGVKQPDGKYIPCPYCYKANTPNGKNMSFATFKKILDTYPKSLTQLAMGADSDLSANPDIWKMMEYCRENSIIPNITLVEVTDEIADKLVQYCGAVAISYHENLDLCADSVKKLTDRGMTQVNVHLVIYNENFEDCKKVLKAVKEDPRFKKLNAVVMLSLKQKGRATKGYTPLSQEKFNILCNYAKENHIGIGFDSCSSLKAYQAFDDSVRGNIIPCESSLESSYIDVDAKYYPCSFCAGESNDWYPPDTINKTLSNGETTLIGIVGERLDWKEGLNVLECNSTEEFLDKIWNHSKTKQFRNTLMKTSKCNECNCRTCPMYNI